MLAVHPCAGEGTMSEGGADHMDGARILTFILAGLTLLALVGGTLSVIRECAGPSANGENCGVAAEIGWPVVMLTVALGGSFALLCARRAGNIVPWLWVCLLAVIGLWGPGILLDAVVPEGVLSVGLLLVIDASAIYSGWRLILRSRSRIPSR